MAAIGRRGLSRVMRPEASVIARPPTIATARRSVSAVHVVEKDGVEPLPQRFGELVERIDLELDLDEVAGGGLGAPEGRADAARHRDVVVLDQHRIVEARSGGWRRRPTAPPLFRGCAGPA